MTKVNIQDLKAQKVTIHNLELLDDMERIAINHVTKNRDIAFWSEKIRQLGEYRQKIYRETVIVV